MKSLQGFRRSLIFCLASSIGVAAWAQVDVGTFPQQYKNAAMGMWPVVEPFARSLFWTLAGIQLAWAAIMLALEKSDLQGWIVGLIRQTFFIGLGAAILLNAKDWMWALFNSFAQLGTLVSNGALEPGDIFGLGLDMAWTISKRKLDLTSHWV
jgi:P-type conjugative transfer protein TrbL